jgi:hypothetical protein
MAKDTSGSAVWTIGQLVNAIRVGNGSSTRVEIPKFQRHIVWNDRQREALIDSIHRGYPIGAILLSKKPGAGDHDVYQVVDGLQRTSTLVAYSQEPLRYVPTRIVPDPDVLKMAQLLGKEEEHVRRALEMWFRRTKNTDFRSGYLPDRLADFLIDALMLSIADTTKGDLILLLGIVLDDLRQAVSVDSVALPVVTYTGPVGELPEIFERINQSGTKLSKYEVFAATWLQDSATQINSEAVRVAINEKYQTIISRGFAISGLEGDRVISDFNLFEYLFGFGKTLVRERPILFSASSDAAETEPAAFSLACVVRGHQLSNMNRLPAFMPRSQDGIIDPTSMEKSIREAAKAVQSWLEPYTALRLNGTTETTDLAHGELQIVSMIARAAAGRWDTEGDWSERENWKEDWRALALAMPQHYLMDLLEETWRGPIYSTLFQRVWEVSEGERRLVGPSAHYSKPIGRKQWLNSLDAWFERQMAREQRTRSYVRSSDRAFLRFVYSGLVSYQADKQEVFELEHLYPVSRLKEVIQQADGPGWPISCVANLALFPKVVNRGKSDSTISEFVRKAPLARADRDLLEGLLLCDIEDVSIGADFGIEEYTEFLERRWESMKAVLLTNLKVY